MVAQNSTGCTAPTYPHTYICRRCNEFYHANDVHNRGTLCRGYEWKATPLEDWAYSTPSVVLAVAE